MTIIALGVSHGVMILVEGLRRRVFLVSILAAIVGAALGAGHWRTDFANAHAAAKKQKKAVLLNFTGSDWCAWCRVAKRDVIEKPEFLAFATNKFVLVEVDFPQETPQPPAIKQANQVLKKKYSVTGFPTFVAIDGMGKELGRQEGYWEGGVEAFTNQLSRWFEGFTPMAEAPAVQERPAAKENRSPTKSVTTPSSPSK